MASPRIFPSNDLYDCVLFVDSRVIHLTGEDALDVLAFIAEEEESQ